MSGSYSRVRIASSHCALLITLVVAHPSTRTPQQTPRAPHPVGGGSPEVGRRDDVNARTHKRWLGMHERGGWRLEVGGRHSTVSCMFVGLVHQCTNEGTSSQRRRKPHRKKARERTPAQTSLTQSLTVVRSSFVRSFVRSFVCVDGYFAGSPTTTTTTTTTTMLLLPSLYSYVILCTDVDEL